MDSFKYTHFNLKGAEKTKERLFSTMPGGLSWLIIIGLSVLSLTMPVPAVFICISFLFYWILRLLYMNIFLVLSFMRLNIEKHTDWAERIRIIDSFLISGKIEQKKQTNKNLLSRFSLFLFYENLLSLKNNAKLPPTSKDIVQIIIIPVLSEGREIIEPGIKSIVKSRFPASQSIIVFALEERASSEVKKTVNNLSDLYRDKMYDILIIQHPVDLPGEARVKGANVTYAARRAEAYCCANSIPIERVIVSCFDADTVVDPDYFNALTYYFQISPDRYHASFQPIPVYHNNVWDAHAFARVLDVGSSFFQLVDSTDPERQGLYSSHSTSFKNLIEVGFWPVDMVSDDAAIYWKSLLHYQGKFHVIPMYVTVSMDVTDADTWWETVKSVYKQRRRWAWSVENVPIVMRGLLHAQKMGLIKKTKLIYKLMDRTLSWSTWTFILSIISWLPLIKLHQEFSSAIIYFSYPRIRGVVLLFASIGLITCIILSQLTLPRCKKRFGVIKRFLNIFEWFFIPLAMIFLNSIPVLDAQTRLMFGKYMGFWTTPKMRKNSH